MMAQPKTFLNGVSWTWKLVHANHGRTTFCIFHFLMHDQICHLSDDSLIPPRIPQRIPLSTQKAPMSSSTCCGKCSALLEQWGLNRGAKTLHSIKGIALKDVTAMCKGMAAEGWMDVSKIVADCSDVGCKCTKSSSASDPVADLMVGVAAHG